MNDASLNTSYRPRWFHPHTSVWWWLESWTYTRFVLRELTSVFVGWASLLLLWQAYTVTRHPDGWQGLLDRLGQQPWRLLAFVTMGALLYHSWTWFALAPRAMVVRVGERRMPDALVAGLNYAGWLAATILIGAICWSLS